MVADIQFIQQGFQKDSVTQFKAKIRGDFFQNFHSGYNQFQIGTFTACPNQFHTCLTDFVSSARKGFVVAEYGLIIAKSDRQRFVL